MGVIKIELGFHLPVEDELCKERIQLIKKNFVSGNRYLRVAVVTE